MNRYPLWKYLLILCAVVIGFIYALPNIYPPDPAIQISSRTPGESVEQRAIDLATKALDKAEIDYFGVELGDKNGLVRFYSLDDQLKAQSLLDKALARAASNKWVVAVNLAPTTPEWLVGMGAGPMKYGLDLAGGVHFLLEVDTPQVLAKEMESIENQLKKFQRKESLRGATIKATKTKVVVQADSEEMRDAFSSFIRSDIRSLDYTRAKDSVTGKYTVEAVFNELYIREKESMAVEQNLSALRKRVNLLGVSEPLVQRQGRNRIVVQLPGLQDTAEAKKIIGKTASLEFRLEAEPNALSTKKELFPFKEENRQRGTGGAYLEKKIVIRGDHVSNANSSIDPETNGPQVNITLNSDGGTLINRVSRKNVGRALGVLFIEYSPVNRTVLDEDGNEVIKTEFVADKKIISLATIQSALNMQFRITGLDNPAEASELALLLKAGALAAPMGFIEERTIGPSLGKQNVETGVKSVQIGLALVLIFMVVYYRVFGIAADIALAVNLILLIAVMSIFGATLTLPGIAGIVLTVGMAVDANVLIFSRVREELKAGMPPQTAIKSGFDRAFTTILDANITTFIVAIILYAIGSGPIKGFAVTLAIGIVTSMFTAILGTRAIVNLIYGNRQVKKLLI
ncbi:MAG: protein translocase subunit SecD [Agarilytica sp.]